MNKRIAMSMTQAHPVWLVSIVNIALGVSVGGFNSCAQSISEVALEARVSAPWRARCIIDER